MTASRLLLYLDASALVKRYVAEPGSAQVESIISDAALVSTATISRAELAAALGRAVRVGTLNEKEALASLRALRKDWRDLIRIRITEGAVARADSLAWEHGLRGYDAVQLAAALLWHEAMGDSVTLATFDLSLWSVVEHEGLVPFPTDLPASLKNWQKLKS